VQSPQFKSQSHQKKKKEKEKEKKIHAAKPLMRD
jgi:hypothetical protein